MGLGKLILRATLGGYFFGHGMQKLAGWFGGHGPEGTGEFFEQVGLRPGRESALVAGAAESGGGSLLALGLFTPVAASMLTGVMTNAIRHVHWKNGLWNTDGGIELPALILSALAALADRARAELVEAWAWPLDEEWESWRPPADTDRPLMLTDAPHLES